MGTGLEIALIAGATAAVGGTVHAIEQGRVARSSARTSLELQKQRQSEEKAVNAARAATERRQQIREERVRRARILQSAENTGTEGSSGEAGALGGLATMLGSNIGANLGMLDASGRISSLNQGIADSSTNIANANSSGSAGSAIAALGSNIFSSAGGFGAASNIFKPTPSLGGGGGYIPIAGE